VKLDQQLAGDSVSKREKFSLGPNPGGAGMLVAHSYLNIQIVLNEHPLWGSMLAEFSAKNGSIVLTRIPNGFGWVIIFFTFLPSALHADCQISIKAIVSKVKQHPKKTVLTGSLLLGMVGLRFYLANDDDDNDDDDHDGEVLPKYAPPPFKLDNSKVVPIDFDSLHTKLIFDAEKKIIKGRATLEFIAPNRGFPMLDLQPSPIKVWLDGKSVDPSLFAIEETPDRASKVRILKKMLKPGSKHSLSIEYELDSRMYDFTLTGRTPEKDLTDEMKYSVFTETGGVHFGFFVRDTFLDRFLLEQYTLSNFEYDQFKHTVELELTNSKNSHSVYTNGTIEEGTQKEASNKWKIEFPRHFTSSSAYLHLIEAGRVTETSKTFPGIKNDFEVIAYSTEPGLERLAMEQAFKSLKDLESRYGPYLHDKLVIYVINNSVYYGMEYCGATHTCVDPDVIDHEITHSWFGRGVMPTGGPSGWRDEAIASWRDRGYPRSSLKIRGTMRTGSPYARYTHSGTYTFGPYLLAQIDALLKDRGGLDPILKKWAQQNAHKVADTKDFEEFLERETGLDIHSLFKEFLQREKVGAP